MSPSPWRTTSALLAAALAVGMAPALAGAAPAAPAPAAPVPAPVLGGGQPLRAPLPDPAVDAPVPDVLDVDISRGTADAAQDRATTAFGADPEIGADAALGREVASFDGTNAVRYDFADGFEATARALTLECTVRFDDGLSGGTEESTGNFCGAKEAGGFSLTAYGSTLKMMVNVDGTYYGAGVEIQEGVWYHATGTWDGSTVALYLNGHKVAETATAGTAIKPPKASARQFFLGADTNGSGDPQFHGTVSVAGAGIYGRALSGEEITARYAQTFAGRTEDDVAVAVTAPAPGQELTAPTALAASIDHEELLAARLTWNLDGQEVALGDEIGPGLAAGEHTLAWSGTDALGEDVSGRASFTSTTLPTPGGASRSGGPGRVQLSAVATSPTGGDLSTVFVEGEVSAAQDAEHGILDPAAIGPDGSVAGDAAFAETAPAHDALLPEDGTAQDAPLTAQVPALRTAVAATGPGQTIAWSGQVDPAREIRLLLLDTGTGRYEVVDSARGTADGQVHLQATAGAEHDAEGSVQILVLGIDPFADDLDNPVRDGFEDPDDYDFSLMHITDTQYLSEGATQRPTAAEREVWSDAYADSYRWLGENHEERKIAYVAHTGDVIENWNTHDTDRAAAIEEYEFASQTQEILEETGVVHSVLPGNHDNRGGNDVAPDSLFNQYFGPERYEALAEQDSWKEAGAEYHPWKEGDNENSYTLFTAAGRDMITVSLGYSVTAEETAWASSVLDRYPGRNAIILTHAYNKPSAAPDGRGGTFSQDGAIIREDILAHHPNVALVLSGHEHGVSISVRRDVGSTGNHVVELLADYQFYEVGSDLLGLTEVGGYGEDTGLRFGSSFFRLLQFDLDRGEMWVDTYSAHLDEFGASEYDTRARYDGTEDDTRLPVQFEGRTTTFRTDAVLGLTPTDRVIGEVSHASGEAATVTWKGMGRGQTRGWFAISRDASRGSADLSEGVTQISAFTVGGPKGP